MRIDFLIDGFNLYHSVKQAISEGHPKSLKWLNIPALCGGILRDCAIGRDAHVGSVHYFTALPFHLAQAKLERHQLFVRVLRQEGAVVHLGQFKQKGEGGGYEEKETDVAIAVHMMETLHAGEADGLFVMSGDTDLMPAVRACRRLFPDRKLCFALPYKRHNNVLKDAADICFKLRPHQYMRYVLPNPYVCPDGTEIRCPVTWT